MDDSQVAQRFAILEAQVKLLSAQLGLACSAFASTVSPSNADVPHEVVELARAGKTIRAISVLRGLTGATLVEAKKVVESL